MKLKLKFLMWQKKNLEKILEKLNANLSDVRLIMKYEKKIQSISEKIQVEKLKELQE